MESTGRESSTNALIEKDFDRETSRSSKYRFPSSREGCFCIPHNNTKRPAREIHSVGKLPACFIALRVSGTQDQSSLLNIHWHSSCARNRENHQCVSSDFRPSYENVPTAFKKQQLDPPPLPFLTQLQIAIIISPAHNLACAGSTRERQHSRSD